MTDYYFGDLDTPKKIHNELIRVYSNNVKRFEISGTLILCCNCSIVLSKSDYIQNYGYCSVCFNKLFEGKRMIWHFSDTQ